jgi:phosphocarrier protein HPr
MLSRTLTIRNPHGVHARAAQRFVHAALGHDAAIRLCKAGKVVNGKSILGLLTLGLKCGDTVAVEIDSDEENTLMQLEAILGADADPAKFPENTR